MNDKQLTAADSAEYQLTPQEREIAKRVLQRLQRDPLLPSFNVTYAADEQCAISPVHPMQEMAWAALTDALGSGDSTFADVLLNQLANVARMGGKLTARELNGVLAMVRGIGPRNPTEAMLAAQMAAIHNATIVAARKLNHADNIPQQDSASTMLNKLARTFTAQVEALKRYRSTGEQNVRVTHQHVSVTAGQAVVGIGVEGGGGNEKSSQSHALGSDAISGSSDARRAALLGREQAVGLPVPCAGSEGTSRMPHARRPRRGAIR